MKQQTQQMKNEEIIKTLNEEVFITQRQLNEVRELLRTENKSRFLEFYKHYKDFYNHKKKLSYKDFENILIDFLINDNETKSYKILDDYVIYQLEKVNRLCNFYEFLEDETTTKLKKYDVDNEEDFFNVDFYDIYTEDLKQLLNLDDEEYKNLNFEDSREHTYLTLKGFNIFEDFKYYENFKKFFDDIINITYNIDLKEVYMRFLLENNLISHYINYDNKEMIRINEKIEKQIPIILQKRLKEFRAEKRQKNKKLKSLKSQLCKTRKPIIKESIKVYIQKLEQEIKSIEEEINEIKAK